jgi:hypothetical protein
VSSRGPKPRMASGISSARSTERTKIGCRGLVPSCIRLHKLADMVICHYESGGSGIDGRAASHLEGLAGRGKD